MGTLDGAGSPRRCPSCLRQSGLLPQLGPLFGHKMFLPFQASRSGRDQTAEEVSVAVDTTVERDWAPCPSSWVGAATASPWLGKQCFLKPLLGGMGPAGLRMFSEEALGRD